MYSSITFGNRVAASISLAVRYGFRSWKMPVLQNCATLSVVNDRATSGGLPPRTDWMIWSSWMALVAFTVIQGNFCLKPASVSSNALSSLSALKPCQNSMVTGV